MSNQADYLKHAEDTGKRCIRYMEDHQFPLPSVVRSYAEEAAWYAFNAHPELRSPTPQK